MGDYEMGMGNSLVSPRLPPHESLPSVPSRPFPSLTNFPPHPIRDCYMVAGRLVAYDEDRYKSVISGTEHPLHAVGTTEFAKVHGVVWA